MKERDRERRGKKEGTCTRRSSIKQCLVTVRARGGGEGEREREGRGGNSDLQCFDELAHDLAD